MSKVIAWGALAWLALGQMAMAQSGEGCLAPDQLRDKDVRRHAAQLARDVCISEIEIAEHGVPWRFTVIENSKHQQGPTIFLLHDNENSAFDTALYAVRKYGGKLVALETGDSRDYQGQDPNRNFGATAQATAPCAQMRRKPAPIFTKFLTDLRGRRPGFVLTLHNNANGHTGNGGSGGISAARQSTVMKGLPAPGGGDEDDAILLAGTQPFEQNGAAQKLVAQLHKAQVNVIYEHVRPEGNDCSFSNYIVLNQLGDYYNIEAQHGHTGPQKRMLDILMGIERVKVRDRGVK
ncbi:hypothetical protein [Roseovarius nubinhibens]|uniref:N-acetylmuramoyl-L-alanine amidase n=1 Tax=Roseovarius nubinhibens (strain ATCC BAA-591 / DSM 15170 / ISM) TaxID=89187 RepID=A3SQQ9_ROSNI|nr:hypothetical protein [Roseovarius nubinhibens]EAP75468.1 hypothetical protein ISM_10106 [Roseovarius nubinhibens ISM]